MRDRLLSDKEMDELVEFREKIISRAISTEPIDREAAEVAYNDLLVAMGNEPVKNFQWFGSPFAMHSELRDQLWGQLRDQLRDQLGGQLVGQLGGQLDQWELQHYMWMDYVAELDGIEADSEKLEKLRLLSKLGEHSFWIAPLVDGAAFCERPIRLVRDDNHNLHYDHGQAIEFPDGWGGYYLHGVRFKEPIYNKIVEQKFTIKDLTEIENADARAVAVQMMRPDRLLKHVGAKLINTGKLGTRLYQVDNFMDTGETEYCMLMDDASTPRQFIEWVEPTIGKQADADLAQASAFGVPKDIYISLGAEA